MILNGEFCPLEKKVPGRKRFRLIARISAWTLNLKTTERKNFKRTISGFLKKIWPPGVASTWKKLIDKFLFSSYNSIQSVDLKGHTKGYTTAGVLLCVAFFIAFDPEGAAAAVSRGEKGWKEENCMVQINGEQKDVQGMSLITYLEQEGYQKNRIAVECNGEILPKVEYEQKILQDGDVLEIVSFVGGG